MVRQLFIDFNKAYDSVRTDVLYSILIEFGIPRKLVELIKMCSYETYITFRTGKYQSEKFPLQKGLKQGDFLSPLLLNFALKYTNRRVHENQEWLKLNGTHQHLAFANDVNTVEGNINTVKKNTEALLDVSKEAGLEGNLEKTKYMLMSRSQKTGQKYSIKKANRSFEDVAKFRNLGTTLTYKNHLHEEIKCRLNSGNACHQSVQSLLSSRLLSRNLKVKIYKTLILPVVLYGYETLSLTLREEHRLKVSENRVLRRIFGPKRDEVTGDWRKLHNVELHSLYSSPGIIRQNKSRRIR
jgi:hypothetical protein